MCCTNLRSVAISKLPKTVFYRNFANDVRQGARQARSKTLREQAMAPAGEGAFTIGKGALAGGAAVGVGALCYYGLGLSNEAGIAEKSVLWPEYVKSRIRTVYFYFGSSLVVTATSAMAAFRSPAIMNIVTKNGFLGLAISIGAIMGTGILAQSIPYKEGLGTKQMAWLLHAGTLGAMLAPMCYMGGPILIRAAWYTAGVVGGLSTIAMCAPSEKFLTMGAPLGMGLGVVFASSIGSMFLPPTSALGAGLYSISLYGGLLLFSAFMLYDTQRIITQAERYPTHGFAVKPYDPINAAMSVYLDTINIFIRIATILAGGGNRRNSVNVSVDHVKPAFIAEPDEKPPLTVSNDNATGLELHPLSPSETTVSTKQTRSDRQKSFVLMMGTGILAQRLPYKNGFGVKQIIWILYSRRVGNAIGSLANLGRSNLINAAFHTLAVLSGISVVAIFSSKKRFFKLGNPIRVFLVIVFVSTANSMFLSPSSFITFSLHRITLYGGLVLFPALILYDTESIIEYAEKYPEIPQLFGIHSFDPINAFWPDYVRKRVRVTFFYLGSSLVVTTVSAILTFYSTSTLRLLAGRGPLNMLFKFGLILFTGTISQRIPYKEGFGKKQMAWLLHVGIIGNALAPLCFLGGPMLMRAALYSTGLISGLAAVAVCAPGRKFLAMGAPLGMALGVVLASSIGSIFLPSSTALGSGFYLVSVYGGLVLFSLFLLYDTQKIILLAEKYPVNYEDYVIPPYDPINSSMSIYEDVLNIFSNIVTILFETEVKRNK
ncbi:hypothetical protein RN001_007873 [Aquatica leii]|uniref:Growth hormone-inducible transmembrane protein n=1 Tax=Aquatica leii TaxID=1421715 RepID=A0AAN7PYL0_9COLE|nr:hypothetical protein RN001_007873 [Aquatica leii]